MSLQADLCRQAEAAQPGRVSWQREETSETPWIILDLQPQFCKGIYFENSGFHSNVVLFSLVSLLLPQSSQPLDKLSVKPSLAFFIRSDFWYVGSSVNQRQFVRDCSHPFLGQTGALLQSEQCNAEYC